MVTTGMFSPVLSVLHEGQISGQISEDATAGATGWYLPPGAAVTISGDHTFKAAAEGDLIVGLVTDGIHRNQVNSDGPGYHDRVGVALFRGRRIDVVPASAALTAGTEVYINAAGKAVAYNATVTGTVAETAATIKLPPAPHGIVWKGGAANADIEVITY